MEQGQKMDFPMTLKEKRNLFNLLPPYFVYFFSLSRLQKIFSKQKARVRIEGLLLPPKLRFSENK